MATILKQADTSVVNRGHYQVPGPTESRNFPDGSSLVRCSHIPWTPWAFEGSAFQLLSINRATGVFVAMIRFLKGEKDLELPDHHHFADVYAYVVDGSFSYEYGSMGKNDYLLESGGVNHAPTIDKNGATFLVVFMGPVCGVGPDGLPAGEVVDAEWMYRKAKENGAADHLPPPYVA